MKQLLLFFFIFLVAVESKAQSPIDSVKTAINNLFIAMKSSNGKLLKDCFADSAILQTIVTDNNGNTIVKNEIIPDFIKTVSSMPKDAVDERINFDIVKIDGALAFAWTPYRFYLNGQFRHCGVNSFQMVRLNGGWKIQYLIDTRRKDGCEEK